MDLLPRYTWNGHTAVVTISFAVTTAVILLVATIRKLLKAKGLVTIMVSKPFRSTVTVEVHASPTKSHV